jgi:hypothetical protein
MPTVEKRRVQPNADLVEQLVAPAAIERVLSIYQQLQERDHSVILQARKILHIYGMVDRGECDEQRLVVGGLTHLKAAERDREFNPRKNLPKCKDRVGICLFMNITPWFRRVVPVSWIGQPSQSALG